MALPQGLPPYVYVILAMLLLLIGGGGGGFWVAWRKDRRQEPLDHLAAEDSRMKLAQLVQQIAQNSVADAAAQMTAQDTAHQRQVEQLIEEHRQETARLRNELLLRITTEREVMLSRIALLEQLIEQHGLQVPPWPERAALSTGGDPDA